MRILEIVYPVTKITPQATRHHEPSTGNCGNSLPEEEVMLALLPKP